MKLVLGTAQFGMEYGAANVYGKPDDDTLCGILATAIQRGVHTLDTAAGYGESEQRIGAHAEQGFDIVTKLPNMSIFLDDVGKAVTEAIEAACARLNVQRLHGLLLHRADNLVSAAGPAIWAAMSRAQADGRVTKIGYSVYDPTELDRLVPDYPPGLVQLPFNGFDQRFAVSGWTRRLREAGCEVHARSIFLQGVLLQDAVSRAAYFDHWRDAFDRFDGAVRAAGCSAGQFAFSLAKSDGHIDGLVCGVDSASQLSQLCDWFDSATPLSILPDLIVSDARLILPQNWQLGS